jgi:hypothetical protein
MLKKPSQDPAPGAMGGAGPGSPNLGRPAPQDALPIKKEGWGSKIVFIDFGRSKIFAVADDSDEVLVFNNLVELAESLRPEVIVLDNLPGRVAEHGGRTGKDRDYIHEAEGLEQNLRRKKEEWSVEI